jgi:4-amino-4-deoxy-L-arabinose transferase-like glycosyltransferase
MSYESAPSSGLWTINSATPLRENPPIRPLEVAAVIGLAAFVLLFKIGLSPLADWDEAIYAEMSREVLQRHSWIPLYWNFQPFFEKPPLFMWTTALFFRVFGESEFWARAASALSGVALCVLMFSFAKRVGGSRTAWLTVTVLLTTTAFYDASRFGTTDILLTLGMYIGLVGLFHIEQNRLWGWYPFWIGFGVAIMTKGAGAAPLFLTTLCVAIVNRWTKEKINRQFVVGALLFFGIVLPWHVYMSVRFGTEFLGNYIGFGVFKRALSGIGAHHSGPRFYLLVLAERATPWVFFLPLAFLRALKDRRLQIPVIFSLVVLIFYTLARTKFPWYIVPAYPAFALIVAFQLDEVLRDYPRLARLYPVGIAGVIAAFLYLSVRDIHGFENAREDLKLLIEHAPKDYSGALLLCSDRVNLPEPADLYYGRRKVVLTYFRSKPPDATPGDVWTSASEAVKTQPDLALIDKKSLAMIPPSIQCRKIAEDKDFVLAMLSTKG